MHHIFGAPSTEILQHIPGSAYFTSGFIDRVDEGAVVAPTQRGLVVRGTRISFLAPVRCEITMDEARVCNFEPLTGLRPASPDTEDEDDATEGTDPSGPSSPPSHLTGPASSVLESDDSVSTDESRLAVSPSIDTSSCGLTFSRAPGQMERLDGNGSGGTSIDGWLGPAHSAALAAAAALRSASSGGSSGGSSLNSGGSGSGSEGDASPTSPAKQGSSSSSSLAAAAEVAASRRPPAPREASPDAASSSLLRLKSTDSLAPSRDYPQHLPDANSLSSQSFNGTMSQDELEQFSRSVFADSVSVRYYARLVVQDCNRLIFWNSLEVVLYA